jgi:hypothetical protein
LLKAANRALFTRPRDFTPSSTPNFGDIAKAA